MLSTVLLAVLLTPNPARAAAEDQPAFTLFPYQKQGRFVTAPAQFLATPVYQLGFMTGALLCLPASLLQDPHGTGEAGHDKEASIVCGRGLGTALGWPVYATLGLPLFIGKSLFYDAPRAVGRALRPAEKPAGAAPAAGG